MTGFCNWYRALSGWQRAFLTFLFVVYLIIAALWTSEKAYAVGCGTGTGTCFALTGNTNAGTSWSDTDGGANCNATCPTGPVAGDACILTSNSGALTLNAALSCSSFNAAAITGTAAYAGTLTHNSAITLTISGNDAGAPAGGVAFSLSAGMTYTAAGSNRTVTFTSTSGTATALTNSKTMSAFIINGAGGTVQLGDALTLRNDSILTVTAGTFNTGNFNITTGLVASSNTNTRTITLGSSTITLIGLAGSIWDTTTTTNLTFNANTSTILVANTATGSRSLAIAGLSFNTISIAATTNAWALSLSQAANPTIATLTVAAPNFINLANATTYNITNAFTFTGTSANPILFTGSATGTMRISTTSGTATCTWCVIGNITFQGGAMFSAPSSLNAGNNAGITITAPSAGGARGLIVGG